MDSSQKRSIDKYVQIAKQEGAEVRIERGSGYVVYTPTSVLCCQVYQECACIPSDGCFYPPTLITKVQPVSTCVQEEVSWLPLVTMGKQVHVIILEGVYITAGKGIFTGGSVHYLRERYDITGGKGMTLLEGKYGITGGKVWHYWRERYDITGGKGMTLLEGRV